MQITFDNIDLNADPYLATKIKHEQSSPRDNFMYQLARERGGVIVDSVYKTKEIAISGRIAGSSVADLESKIDAFKELMSRENKSLEIDYAGGKRRYMATGGQVLINREHFQLSYVEYDATFLVPSGVGEDINPTVDTTTGITVASKVATIVIGGSAYPTPSVKLTLKAVSAVTVVSFMIGGNKITLTKALALNDVIIFNLDTKKVTVNGVEQDYIGMFPKFEVGSNQYQIDITRTSCTYDLEISYIKKWL